MMNFIAIILSLIWRIILKWCSTYSFMSILSLDKNCFLSTISCCYFLSPFLYCEPISMWAALCCRWTHLRWRLSRWATWSESLWVTMARGLDAAGTSTRLSSGNHHSGLAMRMSSTVASKDHFVYQVFSCLAFLPQVFVHLNVLILQCVLCPSDYTV